MNPGRFDLRVWALNQGSLETAAVIIAGWRDGGEARPWGETGPGQRRLIGRRKPLQSGGCEHSTPRGVGEACILGTFVCSTCPHAGPSPGDTGLQLPQWSEEQNKEVRTGRECFRGQGREGVCPKQNGRDLLK